MVKLCGEIFPRACTKTFTPGIQSYATKEQKSKQKQINKNVKMNRSVQRILTRSKLPNTLLNKNLTRNSKNYLRMNNETLKYMTMSIDFVFAPFDIEHGEYKKWKEEIAKLKSKLFKEFGVITIAAKKRIVKTI
jgi:hypothetical protein